MQDLIKTKKSIPSLNSLITSVFVDSKYDYIAQ